jgi:hypothetical protein
VEITPPRIRNANIAEWKLYRVSRMDCLTEKEKRLRYHRVEYIAATQVGQQMLAWNNQPCKK